MKRKSELEPCRQIITFPFGNRSLSQRKQAWNRVAVMFLDIMKGTLLLAHGYKLKRKTKESYSAWGKQVNTRIPEYETDRRCSLIESVCTETTHDSSDQALPRSVLLCWKDPQMLPTHHTFIQLTNQINSCMIPWHLPKCHFDPKFNKQVDILVCLCTPILSQ